MRSAILRGVLLTLLFTSQAQAAGLLFEPEGDTGNGQGDRAEEPSPSLSIPTVVEGGLCTVPGETSATGIGSTGIGLVCQMGYWRRTVSFHTADISTGSSADASCSGLPKGAFAMDSSDKLYVCK